MQPTLLDQGLTLMLVGMGTVFAFLTVLVAGMTLLAFVVNRFWPPEVAAITAAIARHRASRS